MLYSALFGYLRVSKVCYINRANIVPQLSNALSNFKGMLYNISMHTFTMYIFRGLTLA